MSSAGGIFPCTYLGSRLSASLRLGERAPEGLTRGTHRGALLPQSVPPRVAPVGRSGGTRKLSQSCECRRGCNSSGRLSPKRGFQCRERSHRRLAVEVVAVVLGHIGRRGFLAISRLMRSDIRTRGALRRWGGPTDDVGAFRLLPEPANVSLVLTAGSWTSTLSLR
jgi:hypothetical protein